MKRRIALSAALALLTACAVSAQTSTQPPAPASAQTPAKSPAKADSWAGIRFLLGSWKAKTTGGVAQAQVSASYFDCQHSDLLYVYPASTGAALEAIYFDNEGHIIHYAVSTPKPGTVVFLSDPAQPGPQYRLSYTFLAGVMSGQFEMKMPSQTEFTSYLEWNGKRQ